MTKRIVIVLLALAAVAAPALAETAFDPVAAELTRVKEMYRAVTAYHVLMQGEGVTKETVHAVLYDVERYVGEMDNRYETGQLFIKDQKALAEMKLYVAKAHFQCALLHARGVDLEGSITQYEKTVDLLGFDPSEWTEQVERSARPGLLANAAEVAYEMAAPKNVVEDLKSFWSSGLVTRFKVEEYTPAQRGQLKLERIGGPTDPFSEASFALANARFADRTAQGIEEFRVVLPHGRYYVSSADKTVPSMYFSLTQGGVPDPVILNPNTFNFAFGSGDEKCRPQLMLNGLPVKNLQALPFGTYRVAAPANCTLRLPEKITVEQNSEVSLRTEPERLDFVKPGQPIFLFVTTPPGSTYTLRM
jgi:hypothetical protein